MATKAEVRNQVLQTMGILRIGQSATSQDKTEIETAYDELYADLKEEGLATWAAAGSVPSKVVPHVVALVAISRADTYGISDARYRRIAARSINAKREIRRLVTPKHESLDEPVNY